MPREVNLEQRLRSIAEATLDLASEAGPKAVTVRAVAARLGGSTTLVTGYIPNRPALLRNAFKFVSEGWDADLNEALGNRIGINRIRALAHWSLQTVKFDDPIRRFWMESLSGDPRDMKSGVNLADEPSEEFGIISEIVSDAGQPEWLADLLFLAFRGYYVSSIENPDQWTPERSFAAVSEMLNLVDPDTSDE